MNINVVDKHLAEQMQLTEREIESRRELLDFGENDISALKACREFIVDNVDEIVEAFYAKQVKIREIALLIGDADTFQRLRQAMRRYVIELFEGFYDAEYVNKRLRIGKVHKRIGVSPKYYVSAIRVLESIICKMIENHSEFSNNIEIKEALNKLILFDVQLVFDTYIASLVAEVASAKDELEGYVESLEKTVAERTKQLKDLSRQDELTKLHNQRAFREELRRELAVAERRQLPLSLVYFDLNGFKALNDEKGHRAGDEALVAVGKSMIEVTRETDFACRYGGDEFCIILPDTKEGQAWDLCNRLVENFKGREFGALSFSIGIADTQDGTPSDIDDLIKKADKLMYESKAKSKEKAGFYITARTASSRNGQD